MSYLIALVMLFCVLTAWLFFFSLVLCVFSLVLWGVTEGCRWVWRVVRRMTP